MSNTMNCPDCNQEWEQFAPTVVILLDILMVMKREKNMVNFLL